MYPTAAIFLESFFQRSIIFCKVSKLCVSINLSFKKMPLLFQINYDSISKQAIPWYGSFQLSIKILGDLCCPISFSKFILLKID